jgi:hypothetical protein
VLSLVCVDSHISQSDGVSLVVLIIVRSGSTVSFKHETASSGSADSNNAQYESVVFCGGFCCVMGCCFCVVTRSTLIRHGSSMSTINSCLDICVISSVNVCRTSTTSVVPVRLRRIHLPS